MKSLLCVLLAFLAVVAAAPHASAAAVGDDSAIAPFIGEGTIVVGRLDIDRIDQDAFNEYAGTLIESFIKAEFKKQGMADEDMAQIIQEAKGQVGIANTWMTDMAAAGGKRVYVLVDMADVEDDDVIDRAFVVVPMADGADAAKVRSLLDHDGDAENAEAEAGKDAGEVKVEIDAEVEAHDESDAAKAVQIGKAVVYAPGKVIGRLKKQAAPGGKPAVARPELLAALDAAGDAPLRFAFVPGEKTRTLIEENLPALPLPFGGGDSKVLSRGLRWASLGVAQKPTTHIRLALRGQDAEQAKALLETINKGLDFAKDATAGQEGMEEAAKQLAAINPKVEAETVSLDVEPMLFFTGLKDLSEQMGGIIQVDEETDDGQPKPAKKDDGGL